MFAGFPNFLVTGRGHRAHTHIPAADPRRGDPWMPIEDPRRNHEVDGHYSGPRLPDRGHSAAPAFAPPTTSAGSIVMRGKVEIMFAWIA